MRLLFGLSTTVAVFLTAQVLAALPLQEVVNRARGSVAHLSIRDSDGEERSSGSGFVISEDGKLATNFHVAEGARRIVAVFPDGREVEVVGARAFDPEADVAILQLKPGKYEPLPLAKTAAQQGDEVIVIGSPLGLGHAVSTGIVSAVRDRGTVNAQNKDGYAAWALQVSAAIAPGSSGSPLLNSDGEVTGLAVGSVHGQAMYFGIPVAALGPLLAKQSGELKPLSDVRSGLSLRTNLMISAVFIGGISLVWFVVSLMMRRGKRKKRSQVAALGGFPLDD